MKTFTPIFCLLAHAVSQTVTLLPLLSSSVESEDLYTSSIGSLLSITITTDHPTPNKLKPERTTAIRQLVDQQIQGLGTSTLGYTGAEIGGIDPGVSDIIARALLLDFAYNPVYTIKTTPSALDKKKTALDYGIRKIETFEDSVGYLGQLYGTLINSIQNKSPRLSPFNIFKEFTHVAPKSKDDTWQEFLDKFGDRFKTPSDIGLKRSPLEYDARNSVIPSQLYKAQNHSNQSRLSSFGKIDKVYVNSDIELKDNIPESSTSYNIDEKDPDSRIPSPDPNVRVTLNNTGASHRASSFVRFWDYDSRAAYVAPGHTMMPLFDHVLSQPDSSDDMKEIVEHYSEY